MPARRLSSEWPRSAFTLLELLVVLCIAARLLGLLLAAVQKVRSAAASAGCKSNLRQLALASHQFHDAHSALPAGCDRRPGSVPQGGGQMDVSWLTTLLPFVEQDALWREVVAAYRDAPGGDTLAHVRVQATPVRLFRCPADARVLGWEFPEAPWGLTSYQGVAGTDLWHKDGLMHASVSYRLTDVSDGTSTTLMFGERPPGPQGDRGAWYGRWGGNPCQISQVRGVAYTGQPPPEAFGCRAPIWEYRAGRIDDFCDVVHYWSLHPGGGHFAFADGGVRFLPYASAAPLLIDLATRAGGEVVPSF